MPLRITEYGGFRSGRPFSPMIPTEPAIRTQVSTSSTGGAASTLSLSSGTVFVAMDTNDGGAYVLFTSSGSTVVATSTNSQHIAIGAVQTYRFVQPYMRVTVLST